MKPGLHQPPQIQLQSHCWQVTDCKAQPVALSRLSTVIASLSAPETPRAGRHLPLSACSDSEIITTFVSGGNETQTRGKHLACWPVSAKDSPISAQTPEIKGNSLMCLDKPKIQATWAAESLSLCLWVRNLCSTPPQHLNPPSQVPPQALRRAAGAEGLRGGTWRDAPVRFRVHCCRNAMPSIPPGSKPLQWILVLWYQSRFAKG